MHGVCVGRGSGGDQENRGGRSPQERGTSACKGFFSVRRQYFQMQTFLTRLVAAAAILVIVDAAFFDGRYMRAAWREAQTEANLFNYSLSRMVRLVNPARAVSPDCRC